AVAYDDEARDSIALEGAAGTTISNVAAGVDATDAVNRQQMDDGETTTLDSATSYADAGDAQTLSSANTYTDTRIANLLGFDPTTINGKIGRATCRQNM